MVNKSSLTEAVINIEKLQENTIMIIQFEDGDGNTIGVKTFISIASMLEGTKMSHGGDPTIPMASAVAYAIGRQTIGNYPILPPGVDGAPTSGPADKLVVPSAHP